MIIQLDPQIPVVVKLDETIDTWSKGYAFCMIDYSQEHDLLFVISLDSTGEIITIPNNEVRVDQNWSLKRRITKKYVKNT